MAHFTLPELPYSREALAPHLSKETFDYHYAKHHQTYIDNLNRLTAGTEFEKAELLDVVKKSSGPVFNNSAQAWNHGFYWQSLTPQKGSPSAELSQAIEKAFGSQADFEKKFTDAAVGFFGSGWAWLTTDASGSLKIETTANADTPAKGGNIPLFTADVWEHAYYIDYRNARAKYVEAFWKVLNWEFASKNFASKALYKG